MNFKPTLWKSVVSVISGFIGNIILSSYITPTILCLTLEGVKAPCPNPTFLDYVFEPVILGISLGIVILVYVIWSLIQKKN